MTDNPQSAKNLMAALLTAQLRVEAVLKASWNDFHKYRYAAAEDVLEAARTALGECGLIVIQSGWRLVKADAGELIVPAVEARYLVYHAESGESAEYATVTPIRDEKARPLDKALFGALTESLAYFLRGLLLIPRQGEETPDARDDRGYIPPTPPRQAFVRWLQESYPDSTPDERKAMFEAAAEHAELRSADGGRVKLLGDLQIKDIPRLKAAVVKLYPNRSLTPQEKPLAEQVKETEGENSV